MKPSKLIKFIMTHNDESEIKMLLKELSKKVSESKKI